MCAYRISEQGRVMQVLFCACACLHVCQLGGMCIQTVIGSLLRSSIILCLKLIMKYIFFSHYQ